MQLLEAAGWLYQRDLNRTGSLWANALVLSMATGLAAMMGAALGSFVGGTAPGLVLGMALPTGHTLLRSLTRVNARRRAEAALRELDPSWLEEVERRNRELFETGLIFERRTPRDIKIYRVLFLEKVVLVGTDYPQWLPRYDFQVETSTAGGPSRVRLGTLWLDGCYLQF